MDGTVIIADDDKNLRTVLSQSMTRAGAKVRATASLSTLWRWLEEGEGDVVLCDVNLLDGNALDVMPKMRELRPDLQFVVMSAQNTVVTAMRAEEVGAFDYLAKPFDLREMIKTLERARAKSRIRPAPSTNSEDLPLIGRSEIMQSLYRDIARIRASDLPVLIMGETGTGKTLTAEVIHNYSARRNGKLARYDCGSNQLDLLAQAFHEGEGGSILIENIDEALPTEQRQLTNAIDRTNGQIRIIATTRSALTALRDADTFRDDLFERVAVLELMLPNLIDRIDDIGELASYFLKLEGTNARITDEAVVYLASHEWRTHLSELRRVLRRVAVMVGGNQITVDDLRPLLSTSDRMTLAVGGRQTGVGLGDAVDVFVRRFLKLHGDVGHSGALYPTVIDVVDSATIAAVLEYVGGNQLRAAEILGINRNTLRKKIQYLDISVTKSKKLM